jgi:hypothetical protein
VQDECQAIGWQRLNYYAQNWLADLALVTGDLTTATTLLRTGMPVVEQNHDQRRLAFYKRSAAAVAAAQQDWAAAQRWYSEAEAAFDRLGMDHEVEACRTWLRQLT